MLCGAPLCQRRSRRRAAPQLSVAFPGPPVGATVRLYECARERSPFRGRGCRKATVRLRLFFTILGFDEKNFEYPKPIKLIKYLIGTIYKKDAIILDFFSIIIILIHHNPLYPANYYTEIYKK